ncbi:MAG: hypothetical protein ACTHJT_16325 [Cytophaga sp.]|uniref:hypothetical protein n=1 Tax=Cytophaga sp. TaxID=29535 RepID=UPI003F7CFBB2
MKHIFLYLLILQIAASCNHKELACVLCHKSRKKTVTRFENGQVKSIRITKSVAGAIDAPVKTITRYKEFDSTGALVWKSHGYRINSVWDWESGRERGRVKQTVYYSVTDSLKKTTLLKKDGQVIFTKDVRR